MDISGFIIHFKRELSKLGWYNGQEIKFMARALLIEIASLPEYKIITEPTLELSPEISERLHRATAEMATGKPLQYVLGHSDFYGRRFNVNPSVLIPRPETEELVELIINRERATRENGAARQPKILDICSGSGCITHTLQQEIPSSHCYGCDISEEALATAATQPFSPAPDFFQCDILGKEAVEIIKERCNGKVDIIVSNPPYICDRERKLMRPNVLEHEPLIALFVPDQEPLLFYNAICDIATELLSNMGRLFFEINEGYSEQMFSLLESKGFEECSIIKDLNGKARFAEAALRQKTL